MDLNVVIVAVYFGFLIAIGWMFRGMTSNTSDYFRGGGNVLWWMVGACAFMTQFSAWTFTGAASKAYTDGLAVLMIFIGNALGYFFNFLYFAPRFRQMRVVTVVDALRLRFGNRNEQVFAWVSMITTLLTASIGVNALAVITATLFDFSMETTIIVTTLVIITMAFVGGSWAAIAADFFQLMIVTVVSISCAVVAVVLAGGYAPIIERFPVDFTTGTDLNYMSIFYFWCFAIFLKQIGLTNNILYSYRYLTAKDSRHARKGALLACALMVIGPIAWFTPPWFMASSGVDLQAMFPEQGSGYTEGAYLAFVKLYMPAGMVGLFIAAMFSATMGSIDTGLNRNAGIFVKNFLQPVLFPRMSESQLMLASRISTLAFGLMILLLALFINSLQHLSLFDAMLYLSALLGFPQMIPSFLGFFIRRTPDWAAWATILVGAIVSWLVGGVLQPAHVEALLGLPTPMSDREWTDFIVALSLIAHVVITGGFFCLTTLFYKGLTPEREVAVDRFFTNKETPFIKPAGFGAHLDNQQRILIGRTVGIAGILVMAMIVLPNPLWGRAVLLLCGAAVLGIGALLVMSTVEVTENGEASDSDDGADLAGTEDPRVIAAARLRAQE